MLLTEARRPARTGAGGELVPLAEQDRSLWDRELIAEGVALIGEPRRRGAIGEYQLQAAIAAEHAQAAGDEETDWREILALYGLLERMTGNPMVGLNRAIAAAMVDGPEAGLALLEPLGGLARRPPPPARDPRPPARDGGRRGRRRSPSSARRRAAPTACRSSTTCRPRRPACAPLAKKIREGLSISVSARSS